MYSNIDPQLYETTKQSSSLEADARKKGSPAKIKEIDVKSVETNEEKTDEKPKDDEDFKLTPNFTGWTPLITKTNDSILKAHDSITPNSKLLNNILINFNQNPSANDIDYSNNFNLTPFLNHNLSLINSSSFNHVINHNGVNYTPFHDKSLQLTDFFIDSPIRGTPLKDLQTITPSKFLNNDRKLRSSIFQDPKSAKKTSIIDLNNQLLQNNDDETDDELEVPIKKQKLNTNVLNDITNEQNKLKKSPIKLTPIKKQLNEFLTPAKPTLQSSPSTVILSSTESNSKKNIPNSPTPIPKEFKPAMGIFSDSKNSSIGSKSKNKLTATPTNLPIKTSIINSNNARFKPSNRSQMQAGMNKFQIVLNEKTGSKRGRKRKIKNIEPAPQEEPNPNPKPSNRSTNLTVSTNQNNNTSTTSSQNHNNSNVSNINHSTMSHTNNTNNSSNMSNLNISQATDHTSFEQISSTPNGKFFLDKIFEKQSPNSQNLLNQVLSNQFMPPPKGSQPPIQYGNNNVMMMSTPTHQNVYLSPKDDEKYEEGHSLSAFSYPGNENS